MSPARAHWPEEERSARSRLAKILHEEDLIAGSIVQRWNFCGNPACDCRRTGKKKHQSLYVALRSGGKAKLVSLPRALWEEARAMVKHSQEVKPLVERVSMYCLARLKSKAK